MSIFLGFAGLVVATLVLVVLRAMRCSRFGCGVQDLSKPS